MGDCSYILGMLSGLGLFLIFHKPIIKVLETGRVDGFTPSLSKKVDSNLLYKKKYS